MPKRSNEFQRLVFLLIRERAPNAKVTESAMVPDRLGITRREVDVLVETEVVDVPTRLAFEATKGGRKADLPWVEQQVVKHRELLTHKLVLVTRAGFSKPALEYARKSGAEAVTLAQAKGVDWGGYAARLTDLMLGVFTFTGRTHSIAYSRLNPSDPDLVADQAEYYRNANDPRTYPWSELIATILRNGPTARQIMSQWMKGTERPAVSYPRLNYSDPAGTARVISRGVEYVVRELAIEVQVTVQRHPINLQLSEFMGTAVASQRIESAALGAGHADIAVIMRPGTQPTITFAEGNFVYSAVFELHDADEGPNFTKSPLRPAIDPAPSLGETAPSQRAARRKSGRRRS